MTKFNSSFITSKALQKGGPVTGAPEAPAYSPELGQRFNNGTRKYQTIYNDPTGKRSLIRDDKGSQLLIRHNKLKSMLAGNVGVLDISKTRRMNTSEADYFMNNTKGGQRYSPEGVTNAQQQQADASWNSYRKSQRPPGAYHSSGHAAYVPDTSAAPKPNAATYYPPKLFKKGGILFKSPGKEGADAVAVVKKSPSKPKLIAKKAKCGGKMGSKKMAGGKIMKKSGDCGCNK